MSSFDFPPFDELEAWQARFQRLIRHNVRVEVWLQHGRGLLLEMSDELELKLLEDEVFQVLVTKYCFRSDLRERLQEPGYVATSARNKVRSLARRRAREAPASLEARFVDDLDGDGEEPDFDRIARRESRTASGTYRTLPWWAAAVSAEESAFAPVGDRRRDVERLVSTIFRVYIWTRLDALAEIDREVSGWLSNRTMRTVLEMLLADPLSRLLKKDRDTDPRTNEEAHGLAQELGLGVRSLRNRRSELRRGLRRKLANELKVCEHFLRREAYPDVRAWPTQRSARQPATKKAANEQKALLTPYRVVQGCTCAGQAPHPHKYYAPTIQ